MKTISENDAKLVWFEISVEDLDRAMEFYENVLDVQIVKNNILGNNHAFFRNSNGTYDGALIQIPNHVPSQSVKLFFKVRIMDEALELLDEYNGKIIKGPDLLKQKGSDGVIKVGTNLIDGELGGYICEIEDSEGNRLYLYSHS